MPLPLPLTAPLLPPRPPRRPGDRDEPRAVFGALNDELVVDDAATVAFGDDVFAAEFAAAAAAATRAII